MDNIVVDKSFQFAIRIVKLYKFLRESQNEYIMSKQLLRAGTSIGANIAEAQQAQSRADFISKINIALKETVEAEYWLRLLSATDYLTGDKFNTIYSECIEIKRILVSIVKSSKQ